MKLENRIILLIILLSVWGCQKSGVEEIRWASSYDQAIEEAQQLGRGILIDFYTDRCSWCQRLADSTFTDEEFIKFSKDFVMLKVNAKEDTILAQNYRIAGYPTIVYLDPNGQEVDRLYGYFPPQEFIQKIRDYQQGKGTLAALLESEKERPDSLDLLMEIGEKYSGRREREKADAIYQKVVDLDPENNLGKSDDALFQIARQRLRGKLYEEAVRKFRELLSLYPESELAVEAEEYIGYTYQKAGDKERAIAEYEKFLLNHPDHEEADWVKKQIQKLKQLRH
ncbi:tetratricopeptide repeat protein [candidate division KSB1 bacterium]|nr:tetratricopeptide repeat protein [candidate division KSB1 bacterium]